MRARLLYPLHFEYSFRLLFDSFSNLGFFVCSEQSVLNLLFQVHNLIRSFGSIRKSFNIPSPKSPSPKNDTLPKARRPVLNPDASPHANRLARPPRVPEIFEEDEAGSDALAGECSQSPTPVMRRKKSRSMSSSSRLPAPAPTVSPPTLPPSIVATIQVDINESLLKQGKKRLSRRQSGLINITGSSGSGSSSSASSSSKGRGASPPLRPPSPAFGSPLRHDAALAEEEEEYEAILGQRPNNANEEFHLERATSKGKKKRAFMQAQPEEVVVEGDREREKRRLREVPDIAGQRLQDVTNAFGSRVSLPPLDTNVSGMALSVSNPVLFICWQIRIIAERSQILTQICLPRHLLALPARCFRHPEPHPHHRTFQLPATPVHHRYPSRLPNQIPQQWAVSAACARASITLSLSSTRTPSYVPPPVV